MERNPIAALLICIILLLGNNLHSQEIPLPEHPRPDFQRDSWINLNGLWGFQFDSLDAGLEEHWYADTLFTDKILVPFPWGSELSGVKNLAHLAWYDRRFEIPEA